MSAVDFAVMAIGVVVFASLARLFFLLVRDTVRKTGKWGIAGQPPTGCPSCGAELPMVCLPKNVRQMLWGGWTCGSCHVEIDKWGKLLP